MDITYIPMARGFVYLAVVLDWFSRRVLSWRLSITMEAAFCVDTLEDDFGSSRETEDLQVRSSPARPSPACSPTTTLRSAWTGKGAWRDNVFVERGPRFHRKIPRFLLMNDARTRALTARHPIKPTRRCPSAWQPNLGRRSTYRCGKSVQTTGATSQLRAIVGTNVPRDSTYVSGLSKVLGLTPTSKLVEVVA